MAAAESVEHELHVRAYAAAFAEFHAGCLGQCVAQGAGGVLQGGGVDGDGVVGGAADAADAGGGDDEFVQLLVVGVELEVEGAVLAACEGDGLPDFAVADGGDDEGVGAGLGGAEVVVALGVGVGAGGGAVEVDGGEVEGLAAVGVGDAAAECGGGGGGGSVAVVVVTVVLGVKGDGCPQQQEEGKEGGRIHLHHLLQSFLFKMVLRLSFKNRSLCHVEHCSPPTNGGGKRGCEAESKHLPNTSQRIVGSLDCARDDRENDF